MSKPKNPGKAGSASSGKATEPAPAETGDTAAHLNQLMREADEAGGFDGSSLMIDVLQHRLVWFSTVAHFNEQCLNKTANDLKVIHRSRIVLERSRDRRPAPPEIPKEAKATPPPLPEGIPAPPPVPAPVIPAKAMVLNPPPAKAKVTEPKPPSRPPPRSEQSLRSEPPSKTPTGKSDNAPKANFQKADPPKASVQPPPKVPPKGPVYLRPIRDQEPSETGAFSIKACENNTRINVSEQWFQRIIQIWSRNFNPQSIRNGRSCFAWDLRDYWGPPNQRRRSRRDFRPTPNEVGGLIPTDTSRITLAQKMTSDLNNLREYNNATVSVMAYHAVYDRVKKENINYEATMGQAEHTAMYINANPVLRRETTATDREMIELTASGQVMRSQGIAYHLQHLTRHCGKRAGTPSDGQRTLDYFDPDSMAFDLLTLLVKSYELRLHVGGDLLPFLSTVLTNPTHRFQIAIASRAEWNQWKDNGVPQEAWFSRLAHMPILPDNPGAVLVRAGRGQSGEIMSMQGLNRDFRPWTMLVHATDSAGAILQSGNIVTGSSLGTEGRNLIHFSPIPFQVIEEWQQKYRVNDPEIREWLRNHSIFQSLPKDKDFLLFFFADYLTRILHVDLGTTTNGPLEASTFLCDGPLTTESIACVYGFDLKIRGRDEKPKLWPSVVHNVVTPHYNILKELPAIALEENFGNIPSFLLAFADAYRYRNFHVIMRARQRKRQDHEGYGSPFPESFTIGGVEYTRASANATSSSSSRQRPPEPPQPPTPRQRQANSAEENPETAPEEPASAPDNDDELTRPIDGSTHRQRARRTDGTEVFLNDIEPLTAEQEAELEEARRIRAEREDKMQEDWKRKHDKIMEEARQNQNANVVNEAKKGVKAPPPEVLANVAASSTAPPAVNDDDDLPPDFVELPELTRDAYLEFCRLRDKGREVLGYLPDEEFPQDAPEQPDDNEPAEEDEPAEDDEPAQDQQLTVDDDNEEEPDYGADDEDEDMEDEDKSPPVDVDHDPIQDPDEDDDDDKGPAPSSGKVSRFNKSKMSSQTLGASSKAPPEEKSNTLEEMDDLNILDSMDYDYPPMWEEDARQVNEVKEISDGSEVPDSVEDTVPDSMDGSEYADWTHDEERIDLHDDLDERRPKKNKHLPSYRILVHNEKSRSRFFSHGLFICEGSMFCYYCDRACFSMCARCGIFLCFQCRFAKINDSDSICKCSSAYWASCPASMFFESSYEDVFLDDYVVDAENKIVLRSRDADLTEEYNEMKDALARKFDSRSGPYAIGEGAGIFVLRPIDDQMYYQPYDLSYEEFKGHNSGLGYPLYLPNSIDYETWDKLGRPSQEEDDSFILPDSKPKDIERLTDLLSRQFENQTNVDKKRDFENASQTQTETTTLSVLTLALGNYQRQHKVTTKKRFSSEYNFLHRLIYQNSAHVICLTEADSLTDDMIEELMIPGGLHIFRLKHGLAPAVAICVRGDKTASIELLHSNYQETMRESQHGPYWAVVGGIFHVTFGRISVGDNTLVPILYDKKGRPTPYWKAISMMETMESWQHEVPSTSDHIMLCTGTRYDIVSQEFFARVNKSDLPACHVDVRGTYNQYVSLTIDPVTREMRKQHPKISDEIDVFASPPPVRREHKKDVKRAGFPELTVSVFHLNQDVAKKPQVAHSALQRFFQRTLIYQADVLTGDGNSAAYRFHDKQELCHQRVSLIWYLLKNNVELLNERIELPERRISVALECSSRARDEFLMIRNHTDELKDVPSWRVPNLDCMITAVFAYGKYSLHKSTRLKLAAQRFETRDPELLLPQNDITPFEMTEFKVSSVERLKWTTIRSLLLAPKDGDSHLPLQVHINVKKADKKRSHEGVLNSMEARERRARRRITAEYNAAR